MGPIFGYFIFVKLGNRCLGSIFGNTIIFRLLSKSDISTGHRKLPDVFIGDYETIWFGGDSTGEHFQSKLIIRRKVGSNDRKYTRCLESEGNPGVT